MKFLTFFRSMLYLEIFNSIYMVNIALEDGGREHYLQLHIFKEMNCDDCPVSWLGVLSNTLWLLLCRGVRPPPPKDCPGYDTKQSDGEVPVMLELWGMWSTPWLPLLPGPLWPSMVVPDRILAMGLIELKWLLTENWIA